MAPEPVRRFDPHIGTACASWPDQVSSWRYGYVHPLGWVALRAPLFWRRPRGRLWLEERNRHLPARLLRVLYAPIRGPIRWAQLSRERRPPFASSARRLNCPRSAGTVRSWVRSMAAHAAAAIGLLFWTKVSNSSVFPCRLTRSSAGMPMREREPSST